ncbi:hypothetical protein JTE90_003197 [Oedothorax gibbosus]|uniref:Uncharacterized protein n=1 Tax=Oedothorax gibbosus TaxID=931172 RepID=A0AAV6UPJ9_9ARAC|nr:hypothetical protein JTE90_003197 [Oedothorax gibbosus]
MLSAEQLFWCKEWCAAMADKITDFVYADDSKETIDVINVLLLGWILLGLVVYVLGNVIAAHWRRKKGASKRATTRTPSSADEGGPSTAPAADPAPCAAPLSAPAPDDEVEEEGECDEEPLVVAGGELCEWVCGVLGWVRRERVVSPLADAWTDALNASTRMAATEHGLLVHFRSLLPSSRPPTVRAIRDSDDGEQAVECDVELRDASFELGVSGSGEGGGRLPPLPYVLHLHALTGKVCVECSPRDVSFVARYLKPPHMELSVEPPHDVQDVELVERVCRDALRGSCVRLRLACFPDCPRPSHLTPSVAACAEGRELLVKVVRAENLSEGVLHPYCVLEVDDPPQRHATPPAQGTDPNFDTPFTISVKDSAELLFEVHDQEKADSDDLVGLCMVEVGDLLRHPRQRQVVPLSSMSNDALPPTATLTLEFVFSEVGRVETNSRVTAQGTLITTTTIQRTNKECSLVLPLETMPNANANPNPSLHATEDTPHPETPDDNVHDTCHTADETRNMQDMTEDLVELYAPIIELCHPTVEQAAAPNVVHKADSLETESLDSLTDPVVEPLPDTLGQSAEQERLDCTGEQASEEQKVDSHAPNNHPITKFDLHVGNGEMGPILVGNGKTKPEFSGMGDSTADVVGNGTEKQKRVSPAGRKRVPVIKPPPAILVSEEAPLSGARDEEGVAGRALAQLGSSPSGTSRSTLIIHSVHRPESSLSPESPRSSAPPSPQHKAEEGAAAGGGEGSRKRGVLGALRRRLSLRSRSSERSTSPRHTLGSTRSSLSEASGVSAATFVHENSTLVIETNENGIVRRYLVPGGGTRLKKKPRGAKLHIYNDHVFVARHITGSVVCCVCARPLTRRPGKQGYECRGCGVRCHKSCHVRVGDFCPNSSVNAMEVEYLQGGASPKSI